MFLVDTSGSVGRDNFNKLQQFVVEVVDELNVHANHTRVGMATFSSRARVVFNLDDYSSAVDMKQAVLDAPYMYGDTNTADGLKTLRAIMFQPFSGDREDAKNVAVVITDGVSNSRDWQTIPEAQQCKDDGIHIVGIGVQLGNVAEIKEIASRPNTTNTFFADTFQDLVALAPQVADAICEEGERRIGTI